MPLLVLAGGGFFEPDDAVIHSFTLAGDGGVRSRMQSCTHGP
jgi:hypothetical protein